ncbi:hypothetical protein GCK32_016467, partial [Trichostrongylus colubriformis]
MDGELEFILNNYLYTANGMRILIYNGDTDQVCNHLGDQWLIEQVAANLSLTTASARKPWYYQLNSHSERQLAGYEKIFSRNLHLVTVKGSGHLVPMDRPGPSLQMIYNFVKNKSLSQDLPPMMTDSTPLKPEYTGLGTCSVTAYPSAVPLPTIPVPTIPGMPDGIEEIENAPDSMEFWLNTDSSNLTDKAVADMITSLPGLTFNVTFRQFSGYLTLNSSNHLFY